MGKIGSPKINPQILMIFFFLNDRIQLNLRKIFVLFYVFIVSYFKYFWV